MEVSELEGLVVNVTQDHIDKGERGSCLRCPISLALMEACSSDYAFTTTDYVAVQLDPNIQKVLFVADGSIIDIIEGYDEGATIEPFSFKISKFGNDLGINLID